MRVAVVVAILLVVITCVPSLAAPAEDWIACAHQLHQVQRTANTMRDLVQTLASREEGVKNCTKFPEIYDVLRDRCESMRRDHESALRSYQSQLDELTNRLRAVQDACGVEFSLGAAPRLASSQGEQPQALIRRAQQRLKAAGFDPGSADGHMGPRTVKALRDYQANRKLVVTGQLDDATRKALGLE
jgi:hypothetical protein